MILAPPEVAPLGGVLAWQRVSAEIARSNFRQMMHCGLLLGPCLQDES